MQNHKTGINYFRNQLVMDGVLLSDIASKYKTPLFVYSQNVIESNLTSYKKALNGLNYQICYAVKANSNLAILKYFKQKGCGFDIVSGGELARVLKIAADPKKVFYSGVGKTNGEIEAALSSGIGSFQVESLSELETIDRRAAARGTIANILLRVNPEVDPKTHKHISTGKKEDKFGIEVSLVKKMIKEFAYPNCRLRGISCHIGSQITTLKPYKQAFTTIIALSQFASEHKHKLTHINIGGGLGIKYSNESIIKPASLIASWKASVKAAAKKYPQITRLKLLIEPGRSLVGNSGVLVSQVLHLKPKSKSKKAGFAIIDGAMNDVIRPALYGATHNSLPLVRHKSSRDNLPKEWDLVGPICESGDYLALKQKMILAKGDMIVLENCGAYCFTMSSNYNSRPRAAEVMVRGNKINHGNKAVLIRKRDTISDLFKPESECIKLNS